MKNLIDIRIETKELLRSNVPTKENLLQALPMCKELWLNYDKTNNLWDVHQYINCLKKLNMLDEAENIADSFYEKYLLNKNIIIGQETAFQYFTSLYSWIINDKYIRTIHDSNYKYTNSLLNKTKRITLLIKQNQTGVPSLSYIILQTLKLLIKNNDFSIKNGLFELIKILDVELLSSEVNKYSTSFGKEIEILSEKEQYYQYASEISLDLEKYDECIQYCNNALNQIKKFHYDNDIWFQRKIVISYGKIGKIDEAIDLMTSLVLKSDKWFLLSELADLHLLKNDNIKAFHFYLRSVCTKDKESMKVKVIEKIGDVAASLNMNEFAQQNYCLVKQIRAKEGWSINNLLEKKIKCELVIDVRDMKKIWIDHLYDVSECKRGKITKIFSNGKSGLILSDKIYYFQQKNFIGKGNSLKIGDSVQFILCDSIDKKKNIITKEATVITLCK